MPHTPQAIILALLLTDAVYGLNCTTSGFQEPPPRLGRAEVNDWLTCTECIDGELKTVLSLANEAVSDLGLAFESAALGRVIAFYSRSLDEQWVRMAERAKTNPEAAPILSRDQHVRSYVANLVVGIQSRAAHALGQIASPDARKVLSDAKARVKDPTVLAQIDRALKQPPPK